MEKKLKVSLVILAVLFIISCFSNTQILKKSYDSTQITTKKIIQISQNYISEGLKSYESGDFKTTKEHFDIALDNLASANLPDNFKTLSLLQIGLPDEDKSFNLENIFEEVSEKEFQNIAADYSNGFSGIKEKHIEDNFLNDTARKNITQKNIEVKLIKILISKEVERLAAEFGETDFVVPKPFLNKVEGYILSFQTTERNWFQASLTRGERYIPMIKSIFLKKGLPPDLAYMALIESGFNPRAKSPAGARGLWQFMKKTARKFDLIVTRHRDDRLDPKKSTIAASEYITDLVMVFGSRSFMLAMASFNAGDGRVRYALKRVGVFKNRNFWDLVDNGYLSRETCEYVPKIIAAIVIGSNPKKLGFNDFEKIEVARHEIIRLAMPKRLSLLAGLCEISLSELLEMNPDLNKKNIFTPSSTPISEYQLFIPKGKKDILTEKLAMIEKEEQGDNFWILKKNSQSPSSKIRYFSYMTRKGNSLNEISRWFNKPKKVIISWNRFLETRRPQAGDIIFIFDPDENLTKSVHKVKKGESLWVIGRRYKVKPILIAAWNGINKNQIFPGQKLAIYHCPHT